MRAAARIRFNKHFSALLFASIAVVASTPGHARTETAGKPYKAAKTATRLKVVLPPAGKRIKASRAEVIAARQAVLVQHGRSMRGNMRLRRVYAVALPRPSLGALPRSSLAALQGLRLTPDSIVGDIEETLAVKSSVALVMEEGTQDVLFARNTKVALPIASITKLMTTLVVLDARPSMDEMITITNDDLDTEKFSSSRLAVGTTLSRRDMLHLALMSSENRAAHALARSYPGGLDAAIAAMNAKSRTLGMTRAEFHDPTGLSSRNIASAEDLVKLVNAASNNATIREFSTDPEYSVPVGKRVLAFHNTNALVANPSWEIIVQKTGYISEAGKCLVMKAVIEGRPVVIVLLDSFGKFTRLGDANRIRQWMESQSVSTDPITRIVRKTS